MVTVRLFAKLKDLVKAESLEVPVKGPISVNELIEDLFPDLSGVAKLLKDRQALIAVNHETASWDTVVRDGDEVALMPPFAGGSSNISPSKTVSGLEPWIRIQEEDFSVEDEIARVKTVSSRIGGISVFLGTARDFSKGTRVQSLTYEHYAGMAEQQLEKIRLSAKERYNIIEGLIIHRTGEIPAGGNIVLVIVGAEHRIDAFRACQWCIDELKATAPIWKKEMTSDGDVWVEGCP